MNIVYLIGNGFDLSKGLPTAYNDFYKYYLEQPNRNSQIEKLKESIGDKRDNWSDLEEALGKYTANLDTREDLKALHKDLSRNLKTYLQEVEANYDCNSSQSTLIEGYLIYPEKNLTNNEQQRINAFKSQYKDPWILDIITFNYTTVLEKLIGYEGKAKGLRDSKNVSLQSIVHVHGNTSKNMALGLNDISQFINDKFHGDRLLKNTYVKSYLNTVVARTGHDELCQECIKKANLICIFGLSFGITDLRWWQYIGDRLIFDDVRLIIFHHVNNPDTGELDDAELFEEEDRIRELFLSRTSLSDEDKESIRSKIFVSINSSMFKIDNAKFKYKPK